MKKLNLNKIGVVMFALGLAAIIIGGYSLAQAQEGQNKATVAQRTEETSLKLDYTFDYFNDYLTWPSSTTPIDPDYMRYTLTSIHYSGSGNPEFYFTDINGDGLVDMLATGDRIGLLINNGNNVLEPVYLCFHTGSPWVWYGNCVDPSWRWQPKK